LAMRKCLLCLSNFKEFFQWLPMLNWLYFEACWMMA
jgi:hypothetical protein